MDDDDSHTTSNISSSGKPDSSVDTVTLIAILVGCFLFSISIFGAAVFVFKQRKERKKKECHDTGMKQKLIRFESFEQNLNISFQHFNLLEFSCTKSKILGNESDDDHDGYDAAYGDVGIETIPATERQNEPSAFEAVTKVDNVYYEASNVM